MYYSMRSPEEVQRSNGGGFDFERIKERYENTKPLQGKRKALNVRPINARDRAWERMIKVDDNEYYVTCNAHRYWETKSERPVKHTRAITFKYNPFTETEYVIVHTPRNMWGDNAGKDLYPRDLSTPSMFWFYYFNLPSGMYMENYKSRKYVRVRSEEGDKFYTLDKGDITFTRLKGEKYFKPLVVHREFKRTIDRTKTKEVRRFAKPFVDYVTTMVDLVEANNHGFYNATPLDVCGMDMHGYGASDVKKAFAKADWREVVGSPEPTELWFHFAEWAKKHFTFSIYHWDTRSYTYEFKKESMLRSIQQALYRRAMPFIEEEVPLGERSFDRYRNW